MPGGLLGLSTISISRGRVPTTNKTSHLSSIKSSRLTAIPVVEFLPTLVVLPFAVLEPKPGFSIEVEAVVVLLVVSAFACGTPVMTDRMALVVRIRQECSCFQREYWMMASIFMD